MKRKATSSATDETQVKMPTPQCCQPLSGLTPSPGQHSLPSLPVEPTVVRKPILQCDICCQSFSGLPSLGQHRHRHHPKIVNEERLSEMLARGYSRKRINDPVVDKSNPLKIVVDDDNEKYGDHKKNRRERKSVLNTMIKAFREATVSRKKNKYATMRPKARGKMKDWEKRRLWRKMFEVHRKTTVKKLLNGEE